MKKSICPIPTKKINVDSFSKQSGFIPDGWVVGKH